MAGYRPIDIGENTWNVMEIQIGELHTGARIMTKFHVYHTSNGDLGLYDSGADLSTLYEITCAAEDQPRARDWVDVRHLDETGQDPLKVEDGVFAIEGAFPANTLVLHFIDPEFYQTPIVYGAHLALALHALTIGVNIGDDDTVAAWDIRDGYGRWVTVPDYGVRALNYAEEHGLAVNVETGADPTLTDVGADLLGRIQVGYTDAIRAGWTEVAR